MTSWSLEELTDTFVRLADTLSDPDDSLRLLADRCVALIDVAAAGILIIDDGVTSTAGSADEPLRLADVLDVQRDDGPWLDSYRTGSPVELPDLSTAPATFGARAAEAGIAGVHAIPMRGRTRVIGALSLFRASPGRIAPDEARLAQAMAEVTTACLLRERELRRSEALAGQLQAALSSRVIIEQAKGVVSERHGVTIPEAFEQLRGLARRRRERLGDIAAAVINGELPLDQVG